MTSRISVDEFDDLYRTFTTSVWRWEQLPAYSVPAEAEPMRRWRNGESDDLAWLSSWLDQVRSSVAAGKSFQRVRRLSNPPTEYQRWVLQLAPANVAAGEDIRYLTGTTPEELGLPHYDFLLVDDLVVVEMDFDETGRLGGAILHDDAETLNRHRAWRDAAWQHARPANYEHQRSP